jgi:hypothetical protein
VRASAVVAAILFGEFYKYNLDVKALQVGGGGPLPTPRGGGYSDSSTTHDPPGFCN